MKSRFVIPAGLGCAPPAARAGRGCGPDAAHRDDLGRRGCGVHRRRRDSRRRERLRRRNDRQLRRRRVRHAEPAHIHRQVLARGQISRPGGGCSTKSPQAMADPRPITIEHSQRALFASALVPPLTTTQGIPLLPEKFEHSRHAAVGTARGSMPELTKPTPVATGVEQLRGCRPAGDDYFSAPVVRRQVRWRGEPAVAGGWRSAAAKQDAVAIERPMRTSAEAGSRGCRRQQPCANFDILVVKL